MGPNRSIRAHPTTGDQAAASAFLRVRRFGFASSATSTAGSAAASVTGAAAGAVARFSYASSTVDEIRPRVDTSRPLALAHSRIAAVSPRDRPDPVDRAVDIRCWDPTLRSVAGSAATADERSESIAQRGRVGLTQVDLIGLSVQAERHRLGRFTTVQVVNQLHVCDLSHLLLFPSVLVGRG